MGKFYRLLERLLGGEPLRFVRTFPVAAVTLVVFVTLYFAYIGANATLRNPLATGGHATLMYTTDPAWAASLLLSWTGSATRVPAPVYAAAAWDAASLVSYSLLLWLLLTASKAKQQVLPLLRRGQGNLWRWESTLTGTILACGLFNDAAFVLLCKGWTGPNSAPPAAWLLETVFWLNWARIACIAAAVSLILYRAKDSRFLRANIRSLAALGRAANWGSLSLFLVLAVSFGLLPFNQTREALRVAVADAVSSPSPQRAPIVFAFLGVFVFAVSAWLCARMILLAVLENRPPSDSAEGRASLAAFRYWATALSLLCAFLPFVALAVNFYGSAGEAYLSDETTPRASAMHVGAVFSILFALLTVWVVVVVERIARKQQAKRLQARNLRSLRQMPELTKLGDWLERNTVPVLLALLSLPVLVLGVVGYFTAYRLGASVGALGAVLFGLAGLIPFGTIALYARIRTGIPVLSLLIALAVTLAFYNLNDEHAVRSLPPPKAAPKTAVTTATATDAPFAFILPSPDNESNTDDFERTFSAWLQNRPDIGDYGPDEAYPVFLVAAEGGGIRAAGESALTLALAQDADPRFRSHLFAISGVSGGSVGAAVFAAECQEADKQMAQGVALPSGWWTRRARSVVGADMLAPTLSALLYGELPQAVWPYPVAGFDRAAALESAFEEAWYRTEGSAEDKETEIVRTVTGSPLAAPFYDYATDFTHRSTPALLLNTTNEQTGDRMVVSNVPLPGERWDTAAQASSTKSSASLLSLAAVNPTFRPRLSTAAFLSARFTYISPSGYIPVPMSDAPTRTAARFRYVDGGYFENSGAATLVDLMSWLKVFEAHPKAHQMRPFRLFVLRIGFDYEQRSPSRSLAGLDAVLKGLEKPRDPFVRFDELTAPLGALFATRDGRARLAVSQLRQYAESNTGNVKVSGTAASPYIDVRFVQEEKGARLPFGWLISGPALSELTRQIQRETKDQVSPLTRVHTAFRTKAGAVAGPRNGLTAGTAGRGIKAWPLVSPSQSQTKFSEQKRNLPAGKVAPAAPTPRPEETPMPPPLSR